MRRWRFSISVVCASLSIALGWAGDGYVQPAASDQVEILVQGETYPSVLDYKRNQIKKILSISLSSHNLSEFSEEELCAIIKEVQKEQVKEPSSDQKPGQSPQGASISQMNKMLGDYLQEHQEADSLTIDPDKVKSIIINQPQQP